MPAGLDTQSLGSKAGNVFGERAAAARDSSAWYLTSTARNQPFFEHERYYPAVRDSSEDRLPLRYQSGEEIIKGDHVLLSGEPGVIEIVADPEVSDPSTEWYVQEFGGGVMISKLQRLGSVFTGDPASDSDLQFICRSETEADASQN